MDIITRFQSEFPGHVFETKKGMFGQQFLIDGTPITATWELPKRMNSDKKFADLVKGLTPDEKLYVFIKDCIEKYLGNK